MRKMDEIVRSKDISLVHQSSPPSDLTSRRNTDTVEKEDGERETEEEKKTIIEEEIMICDDGHRKERAHSDAPFAHSRFNVETDEIQFPFEKLLDPFSHIDFSTTFEERIVLDRKLGRQIKRLKIMIFDKFDFRSKGHRIFEKLSSDHLFRSTVRNIPSELFLQNYPFCKRASDAENIKKSMLDVILTFFESHESELSNNSVLFNNLFLQDKKLKLLWLPMLTQLRMVNALHFDVLSFRRIMDRSRPMSLVVGGRESELMVMRPEQQKNSRKTPSELYENETTRQDSTPGSDEPFIWKRGIVPSDNEEDRNEFMKQKVRNPLIDNLLKRQDDSANIPLLMGEREEEKGEKKIHNVHKPPHREGTTSNPTTSSSSILSMSSLLNGSREQLIDMENRASFGYCCYYSQKEKENIFYWYIAERCLIFEFHVNDLSHILKLPSVETMSIKDLVHYYVKRFGRENVYKRNMPKLSTIIGIHNKRKNNRSILPNFSSMSVPILVMFVRRQWASRILKRNRRFLASQLLNAYAEGMTRNRRVVMSNSESYSSSSSLGEEGMHRTSNFKLDEHSLFFESPEKNLLLGLEILDAMIGGHSNLFPDIVDSEFNFWYGKKLHFPNQNQIQQWCVLNVDDLKRLRSKSGMFCTNFHYKIPRKPDDCFVTHLHEQTGPMFDKWEWDGKGFNNIIVWCCFDKLNRLLNQIENIDSKRKRSKLQEIFQRLTRCLSKNQQKILLTSNSVCSFPDSNSFKMPLSFIESIPGFQDTNSLHLESSFARSPTQCTTSSVRSALVCPSLKKCDLDRREMEVNIANLRFLHEMTKIEQTIFETVKRNLTDSFHSSFFSDDQFNNFGILWIFLEKINKNFKNDSMTGRVTAFEKWFHSSSRFRDKIDKSGKNRFVFAIESCDDFDELVTSTPFWKNQLEKMTKNVLWILNVLFSLCWQVHSENEKVSYSRLSTHVKRTKKEMHDETLEKGQKKRTRGPPKNANPPPCSLEIRTKKNEENVFDDKEQQEMKMNGGKKEVPDLEKCLAADEEEKNGRKELEKDEREDEKDEEKNGRKELEKEEVEEVEVEEVEEEEGEGNGEVGRNAAMKYRRLRFMLMTLIMKNFFQASEEIFPTLDWNAMNERTKKNQNSPQMKANPNNVDFMDSSISFLLCLRYVKVFVREMMKLQLQQQQQQQQRQQPQEDLVEEEKKKNSGSENVVHDSDIFLNLWFRSKLFQNKPIHPDVLKITIFSDELAQSICRALVCVMLRAHQSVQNYSYIDSLLVEKSACILVGKFVSRCSFFFGSDAPSCQSFQIYDFFSKRCPAVIDSFVDDCCVKMAISLKTIVANDSEIRKRIEIFQRLL